MTERENATHAPVAADEYVRKYVEALHEERAELREELEAIRRREMSRGGRAVSTRVVQVMVAIAVLTLVYLLGRGSV